MRTVSAPASAPKARTRKTSGRFVEATYSNHFGTRSYKTYLPARGEGQPRPLVVMLHGCDQDADDFAAGTRMNELADDCGFIVAYPTQAASANHLRCWNWFDAANQQRDRGEASLVAGITRQVMERCNVDPARVYVAGLSAGGAMAAIMGRTYPDLYAAVGIHSGLAYGAATDVSSALAAMRAGLPGDLEHDSTFQAVPTIVFHGDGDTTVHPSNGEQVIARAVPRDGHPLMPADAPRRTESGEERGRKYTRITQTDASGRPILEHWLVHGAGHAWSGGSDKGSYADPSGPDATRAMLRFFFPA